MKAYMYRAALYCESCGLIMRNKLPLPEGGADLRDESTFDSDQYPKGPYANGGGEADTPQHCDACGVFLENPLTPDGDSYVREAAKPFERLTFREKNEESASWEDIASASEQYGSGPLGNGPVVAEWIRFYLAPGQ